MAKWKQCGRIFAWVLEGLISLCSTCLRCFWNIWEDYIKWPLTLFQANSPSCSIKKNKSFWYCLLWCILYWVRCTAPSLISFFLHNYTPVFHYPNKNTDCFNHSQMFPPVHISTFGNNHCSSFYPFRLTFFVPTSHIYAIVYFFGLFSFAPRYFLMCIHVVICHCHIQLCDTGGNIFATVCPAKDCYSKYGRTLKIPQ